jgi:hypothetical protein
MDESRENLLPKVGASSYSLNRQAIETLPQGENTAIDKVIPGVSGDSAVSNPNFHVRNEYANVQYRINGIVLPEVGLRPGAGAGYEFRRQPVAAYRHAAGAVRASNGRVLDLTSRSFSARRQRQPLWRHVHTVIAAAPEPHHLLGCARGSGAAKPIHDVNLAEARFELRCAVAVPLGRGVTFRNHASAGRDFMVSDKKQKSTVRPTLMTVATESSVNSA